MKTPIKYIILCLSLQLIIFSQINNVHYPLTNYNILQGFANQSMSFRSMYHCADDLQGIGGTEVFAIADGKVVFSGKMNGYGWLIVIEHKKLGIYSLYGHLSTRRNKELKGLVKAKDRIAFLADDDEDGSGSIDGKGPYPYWRPHLHFAIRKGSIKDYSERKADRWMAGYTKEHPKTYKWLNPKTYIEGKQ